ncbi:MAG: hypothetical protein ABH843_02775 [Candidatus Omnitrophota bacterium]
MSILPYGLVIFFLAIFFHFIIWRLSLPKRNQSTVLLVIFYGAFIISVFILKKFPGLSAFDTSNPQALSDHIHLFIFFSSLTFSYIISYSAIGADSPSMNMVLKIARSAPDGLERDKIAEMMTDDYLIKPRLKELINNKMVYMINDVYRISKLGELFVKIFVYYRDLLNLPKGG